ncbi:MAG: ABC transporter permease, partial [Gaiellaceae bacterium]
PLTHAIAAARRVAAGASLGSVETPIAVEAALGVGYLLVGLMLLRVFEEQGRRQGSLDRA